MQPGEIIRAWRHTRRMSQLGLATEADISARHLSFVETGRAGIGAGTVLTLARVLEMPLLETNRLLIAAGHAPQFSEAALSDDEMAQARRIVDMILKSHEPYPAYVINENWDIVSSNNSQATIFRLMIPEDRQVEIGGNNLLRFMFHPAGMRNAILNWAEIAPLMIGALNKDIAMFPGKTSLRDLKDECLGWLARDHPPLKTPEDLKPRFALPLHLRLAGIDVGFVTTALGFAAPLATELQNLRIETFYPEDEQSELKLSEILSAAETK